MAGSSLLNLGLSGLRAHQLALGATGQNITNANTEGYSRQRAEFTERSGLGNGVFQGQGVTVGEVGRLADDLLSGQVRRDAANAKGAEAFLSNVGQLDSLLADERTGLAPALTRFFGAINSAADDPASLPTRRLVLAEADALVDRFRSLNDRMNEQAQSVDASIGFASDRVSDLARSIADLNAAVHGSGGGNVNGLLDQRDALVTELAGLVDVRAQLQNEQVNVYVGTGQALVMGSTANSLSLDTSLGGRVLLQSGQNTMDVTASMSGGELGGLLKFRSDVLAGTQARVGALAVAVTGAVNEQHQAGVDLTGARGGLFFEDLNTEFAIRDRVTRLAGSGSGTVTLAIDDGLALTGDEYELRFDGPGAGSFDLLRRGQGAQAQTEVVARGMKMAGQPVSLSFDGLQLELSGDFTTGERFRLEPTRNAADGMRRAIAEPEELALAAPMRTARSLANLGTGQIALGTVVDADFIQRSSDNDLLPPLLIEFTSETTYNVLDNTDVTNPTDLDPPLRGQAFVPGTGNTLFPAAEGSTIILSEGGRAGALPGLPEVASNLTGGPNGYLSESVRFEKIDEETGGTVVLGEAVVGANASARSIAQAMSAVEGVVASAETELELTGINENGIGLPMAVFINGVELAAPPEDQAIVPLTADMIADRINDDVALRDRGIIARSDGTTLTVTSIHGDDLTVHVRGDNSDSLLVRDRDDRLLELRGQGEGKPAELIGTEPMLDGADLDNGGPFRLGLAVDGGPSVDVDLSGIYPNATELAIGIQRAIDASALGPGKVSVGVDADARLVLRSTSLGTGARIAIVNTSVQSPAGDELGLTNSTDTGEDSYGTTTIGGRVTALLNPDITAEAMASTPNGNVFRQNPDPKPSFFGFQVAMNGRPVRGDQFSVDFNRNGVGDNRNGLELAALATRPINSKGLATFNDTYGEVVSFVGTNTAQARLEDEAARGLLQNSQKQLSDLSGVNLDEEAANLLRFEQGYNASTRVIGVARALFDELLSVI